MSRGSTDAMREAFDRHRRLMKVDRYLDKMRDETVYTGCSLAQRLYAIKGIITYKISRRAGKKEMRKSADAQGVMSGDHTDRQTCLFTQVNCIILILKSRLAPLQ